MVIGHEIYLSYNKHYCSNAKALSLMQLNMDPFIQMLFKMLFVLCSLQKKFENFSCHLKDISRSFQDQLKITNVTVLVSHSVIAWKLH